MEYDKSWFYEHIAQTSPEPVGIEVVKGSGIYLYGPNGEKYIDFISGICVNNVGHSTPEVVEAIHKAAGQYQHPMVYGEYIMPAQVAFAKCLVEHLDPLLSTVYFTNSGTEAIEASLKLSKKFTGRQEIIACTNSYHGSTHASLAITGNDNMKMGYGPFVPHVQHIPFNDFDALNRLSERTACMVLEVIQGAGGMILPEEGYLKAVRKRCDQVGALLVLDEIQTGFGRSGSLFAHQAEGVVPDILVLAKALGGGLPLGAFISSPPIMSVIKENPILGHITTFGGNPVCCAAGMAALNKIVAENLVQQIPAKEKILAEGLQHPLIKTLRGRGLMYALIFEDWDIVVKVNKAFLKKGILSCYFLNTDKGLRLCPPLTITMVEMDLCVNLMLAAIEEVYQDITK